MGKPEETDHLEKLVVHERIILKWIKQDARVWTGFTCSGLL
jgi:hypothetical protein